MRQLLLIVLCVSAIAGVHFIYTHRHASTAAEPNNSIIYENKIYGFRFALPKSWEGYSVETAVWTGYEAGDELGETATATGPVVSLRNPRWTDAVSYQDIPIMIFTLAQWSDLQNEKFHIGAAPIGPSELGRNARYVFALPARYNFSFPAGHEEVEQILAGNPLSPF